MCIIIVFKFWNIANFVFNAFVHWIPEPISFLLIVTNPGTAASCLKKSTVDEKEIEGATANLAAAKEIHLQYVAVQFYQNWMEFLH